MTVTVFRHMVADGLGSLAAVLAREGLAYDYIDTPHADLGGFDPLAPDLLIVMGGAPGVYQAADYPFLQQELRILRERLAAHKPTLGICLGGQLMAAALGAEVRVGTQGVEKGWYPLTLTAAGRDSPLAHLDGAKTPVLHWHGDTFALPEGAVLLAGSAHYPHQAFAWGDNAIGLQFHPEMTPQAIENWLVEGAGDVADGRLDIARIRAETARYNAGMIAQADLFLCDFLTRVGIAAPEGGEKDRLMTGDRHHA